MRNGESEHERKLVGWDLLECLISFTVMCPMPIMSQGAVVNASQICPVGDARWQGEWLMETDFLKDFQARYGQWIDCKGKIWRTVAFRCFQPILTNYPN